MNIYILVATINGYTATDIIINNLSVCGLITLNVQAGTQINEYYDFREYCISREVKCIAVESYSLEDKNDRYTLAKLKIDLLLVLGWQRLIPKWLIEQCRIGAIGVHGSPWGITGGRGRSPQNWALLLGEKHFYVSIFWIDENIDSGEVIDTTTFDYSEADDINTSYLKCGILTANMIINNIHNNRIILKQSRRQDESASYLPQRIAQDGEIDWHRNGRDIYNFVRALTKPYPGAYSKIKGEIFYIWHVLYLNINSTIWKEDKVGTIVQTQPNGELLVKCKDGIVYIDNYQNKNQIKLHRGDMFESADFSTQIDTIIRRHYSKYNNTINSAIETLRN